MTPDELKAIRAKLDLTQIEMAKLLGYSSRQIQHWESGSYPIPRAVEMAVAAMKPTRRSRKDKP